MSSSGSAATPSSLQISKNLSRESVMVKEKILQHALSLSERLRLHWSPSEQLRMTKHPTTMVARVCVPPVGHPRCFSYRPRTWRICCRHVNGVAQLRAGIYTHSSDNAYNVLRCAFKSMIIATITEPRNVPKSCIGA